MSKKLALLKQPRKLSDLVYSTLEQAILNQDMSPGQKLFEDEISGELGVSTTPVREAFVRLEREGLIILPNHRTAFVRVFSEDEILELYDLREALEQMAVKNAIKNTEDRDIQELVGIVQESEEYLQMGDYLNYLKTNINLHMAIIRLSGNRLLERTMRGIQNQLLTVNIHSARLPGMANTGVKEHYDLIEALRAKKAKVALNLISSHISQGKQRSMEAYSNYLQQPKGS